MGGEERREGRGLTRESKGVDGGNGGGGLGADAEGLALEGADGGAVVLGERAEWVDARRNVEGENVGEELLVPENGLRGDVELVEELGEGGVRGREDGDLLGDVVKGAGEVAGVQGGHEDGEVGGSRRDLDKGLWVVAVDALVLALVVLGRGGGGGGGRGGLLGGRVGGGRGRGGLGGLGGLGGVGLLRDRHGHGLGLGLGAGDGIGLGLVCWGVVELLQGSRGRGGGRENQGEGEREGEDLVHVHHRLCRRRLLFFDLFSGGVRRVARFF